MEYNTKTRRGIFGFLVLMFLVFSIVMMTILASFDGEGGDLAVNGTPEYDDAVYVNATPEALDTLPIATTEMTTMQTTAVTTENPAVDLERKPIYYVTISGNSVVVLDEYGEFLQTVNENAAFLPKQDVAVLRRGIEIYTKEELALLMADLS